MVLSLVAIIVSVLGYLEAQGARYRWFAELLELFWKSRPYWWYEKIPRYAAAIGLAGYVGAYHYDATVGRAMLWIKSGR